MEHLPPLSCAITHTQNGLSEYRNGDLKEALHSFSEAQLTFGMENQRYPAAASRHMMAFCYADTSRFPLALDCFQKAAGEYGEAGDFLAQAHATRDYGTLLSRRGRSSEAWDALLQSKDTLLGVPSDRPGRDQELCRSLLALETLSGSSGAYLPQALELARASGLALEEAIVTQHLGELYAQNLDHSSALTYYQSALWILECHAIAERNPDVLAELWLDISKSAPHAQLHERWEHNAIDIGTEVTDQRLDELRRQRILEAMKPRFNY